MKTMRTTTILALTLSSTLAADAAPLDAQSPRDDLVVSAEWLRQHARDPRLVILHAGGHADRGYIPGARRLDLDRITYSRGEVGAPDHAALELPEDLSSARAVFEEAGVGDDSRIVVTFEGRSVPVATRVIWTLEVLGLGQRTVLLDGGNEAWMAAGGALTAHTPDVPRGRITADARPDRRVERAFVRDRVRSEGFAVVDARTAASYDGVAEELPGRAGHVPGAGNIHFRELFDERMRLRPSAELEELFARAGVEPGETVIAYCHIGLWATTVVLAARTLGYDAVLYDGSMQDWAADPDLPLATGGAR